MGFQKGAVVASVLLIFAGSVMNCGGSHTSGFDDGDNTDGTRT